MTVEYLQLPLLFPSVMDYSQLANDQNNMRSHLIHCLERSRMELFPVRRERRENSHSQSIKVYCVCRMPEESTRSRRKKGCVIPTWECLNNYFL